MGRFFSPGSNTQTENTKHKRLNVAKNEVYNQGTLTEGEGSVQFTSSSG